MSTPIVTRRNLLKQSGMVALATPFTAMALPSSPVSTLAPVHLSATLLASITPPLVTAANHAKQGVLTAADLSRVSGSLRVAFELWKQDGTVDAMQRKFTRAFLNEYRVTDDFKNDLSAKAKKAGAVLEAYDFNTLDSSIEEERGKMGLNVATNLDLLLNHLDRAVTKMAKMDHPLGFNSTFLVPATFCYSMSFGVATAGMLAAICAIVPGLEPGVGLFGIFAAVFALGHFWFCEED